MSLTVGELRAALENLPDDAPVNVWGADGGAYASSASWNEELETLDIDAKEVMV